MVEAKFITESRRQREDARQMSPRTDPYDLPQPSNGGSLTNCERELRDDHRTAWEAINAGNQCLLLQLHEGTTTLHKERREIMLYCGYV